jgi:RNA-directed DNA polymerase
MHNILALHRELAAGAYRHGGYHHFKIADPKPRDIHKASVRDRLVHHALYRQLYPFFDRIFISDSYSCRLGKGTHRAMNRFRTFAYQASKNNTRTCWVLKCDIRKFFASIDQPTLFAILRQYLSDERTLSLLWDIVESFHSTAPGKGLPLGNLTSQLLVNIYLNEFDHFVKHRLKATYYVRYADDFVALSHDRNHLLEILLCMEAFLRDRLLLALHPDKVSIETLASGIDFLGWVHFSDHRVLRTSTKRRMFRTLAENPKPERLSSYMGMLTHGNTRKLSAHIEQRFTKPSNAL